MRTPVEPTVILLPGPHLNPHEIEQISEVLERAYRGGSRRFLIDCSDVAWAGMDFIALLVNWSRRLRPDRGSIRLGTVCNSIEKLLQVTQADRVVPSYRSSDAAFAAFDAQSA